MVVNSKNALNAKGYLYIEFTYKIRGRRGNFHGKGQSHVYNNVRLHKNKMLDDAIMNGVIKDFPKVKYDTLKPMPYNIIIIYYSYFYYIERYQITERKGKYYEKFRDKEKKRTRYFVINDKNVIAPDSKYKGIYK